MEKALVLKKVNYKINNHPILRNISLTLFDGEILGILGPNGAGKTTLLSLLNGLRDQQDGEIYIFNQKLPFKSTNLKSQIGVVLQETALYEELTVVENLKFYASLYNLKNPLANIISVLELLKLSDRADQMVSVLSGGLKRRLSIARALLHGPKLLIIDEPTLGVDVEARHFIWQHLKLLKSKGNTVIVATNYLDEAQALCDKVAVLNNGKMVAFETPQALISRAGYCLDVEAAQEELEKIKKILRTISGVIRFEDFERGISIFVKSDFKQEVLMSTVLKNAEIDCLRARSADLAEVFKALKP